MSHAGFDGLHTPAGFALIVASGMFLIVAILFGAYFVKQAQEREKVVRAKLRAQYDEQHPKTTP
jgi:hypothetical protein